MFPEDAAAPAQQMPIPGEGDLPVTVTIEPELTLRELTKVWTLGVGSDRSLERPKEWNGDPVVSTTLHSSSRIGCLGFRDAERFLDVSANVGQPIIWATLAAREKVVARGVATALRALAGGKALSCIRHHPEKQKGFKMWRLL